MKKKYIASCFSKPLKYVYHLLTSVHSCLVIYKYKTFKKYSIQNSQNEVFMKKKFHFLCVPVHYSAL